MAHQWYYGHDATRHGPYSACELRALAADGRIGITDTIWREGVDRGQVAANVKNLFPPSPAEVRVPVPASTPVPAEPESLASGAGAAPAPLESPKKPARQARAVAGRGIVIVSQDGLSVWFKKKCFVCGFEDAMRGKMLIKRGSNRMSFLCHKCRKMRDAEFQGIL